MNQPAMTLTRSLPNKIALPRPQRSANVPDNLVAFNDPLQRSSWSPTTRETEDDARGCLPTSRRDGFGRALGLNGGRATHTVAITTDGTLCTWGRTGTARW